jgi:kexin
MDLLENMAGGEFIVPGGLTNTVSITRDMLESANFESLEHITITVWISHTRRGDVEVDITSPHGIKSVLGAARKSDHAKTGYPGWTFMSVKHWSVIRLSS